MGAANKPEAEKMAKKTPPMFTEEMKAEAKHAADALRRAGFDVFSSGYGSILVRLNATDQGYTSIPTEKARQLLATA